MLVNRSKIKNEIFIVAFLSALITFVAILPTLIRYSGNLYLVGDYMTQIIPFIKEGRRIFLSGTPFWSSNSFLGANYIGTYSYYVYSSPLFWPLLLFSESNLGIGISIIFIIKHVIAGISSYLFLSTHFKEKNYAILGALIYTFSSFTFDSTYYFIFLDVIAVFPLFLFFVEKVLYQKHYTGFIFVVFLNAIVNYYCFIGTSLFFLLYLFFRIKHTDTFTWKNGYTCILLYIAGVTLSSVILLPAACTLLDTSKAVESFSKIFISAAACIPQIFKLIRALILPSEGILGSGTGFTYSNFCSNAGFLPFFGAVFSLMALRQKKKNWNEKLLKVLLIVTFLPFGNGLFTLFSNLNYTRWWYILVMIMVLSSLKVMQSYENNNNELIEDYSKNIKFLVKIALVVTLPMIVVKIIFAYFLQGILNINLDSSFLKSIENSGLMEKFTENDVRYIVALIFLIAVSYIPFHIVIKRKQLYNFKKIIPIVAIICAISYLCYLSTDSNILFGEMTSPYVKDSAVTENTEYKSRTDFEISLNNYSMIVNQPSINTFNSFKSKATAEFSRLAGFDSHPITKKHFNTEAIQTVLSISTIVNKNKETVNAEYYCPFGYVYNYYVLDENFEVTSDKVENNRRIELMCEACIINKEIAKKLNDVVSPLKSEVNWKDAYKKDKASACSEFTMTSAGFEAKSSGDCKRLVYFSIPNDKGWEITVNGVETEVLTINGGMIGIVVPAGESIIKATFVPPMLNVGIIISCISFIAVIIFAIINSKKAKKMTENSAYDNILKYETLDLN